MICVGVVNVLPLDVQHFGGVAGLHLMIVVLNVILVHGAMGKQEEEEYKTWVKDNI